MPIRRSILLAAAAGAAFAATPALAGDGYGASDNGSWEGDYSYDYDAPQPAPYVYEAEAGADYAGAYSDEADYYDEPVYDPAPRAYAHPHHAGAVPMPAYGQPQGLPPQPGAQRVGYSDAQRAEWLHECRRRYGRDNDNGLGGAVIGGLVGGVAGNRIAGRGNRVIGTVIGAGVGALAGSEIDKAEDRGRAADECEAYLDQYEAYYAQGGGQAYGQGGGFSYGYGQNVMWVPVVVGWNCKPKKHEVVEEWVEVPAKRVVYTKPAPTKLIKTKTKVIKQPKYSK